MSNSCHSCGTYIPKCNPCPKKKCCPKKCCKPCCRPKVTPIYKKSYKCCPKKFCNKQSNKCPCY